MQFHSKEQVSEGTRTNIHEFIGEPTPQDIHELYLAGLRLGRQLYDGECADLYRANGRTQLPLLASSSHCATEFLIRHSGTAVAGALVGPAIVNGIVLMDSMTLYVR